MLYFPRFTLSINALLGRGWNYVPTGCSLSFWTGLRVVEHLLRVRANTTHCYLYLRQTRGGAPLCYQGGRPYAYFYWNCNVRRA